MAELGRDEDVLARALSGPERTSGWQTARLYDLACEAYTTYSTPPTTGTQTVRPQAASAAGPADRGVECRFEPLEVLPCAAPSTSDPLPAQPTTNSELPPSPSTPGRTSATPPVARSAATQEPLIGALLD